MTHIEVCPGTESVSGATTTTTTVDADHYIEGLGRRRNASHRVPPYGECSCSDPWTCRHYEVPASPGREADGYYATAQHLLAAGLLPAPNVPAMRVMWRDPEQRDMVRYIAERWEMVA
jgi:hypothetical protein